MEKSSILTKVVGLCSGMTLAATLITWLPKTAQAQEKMKPMKGAEHLIMLNHVNTPAQAEELKPGDSIAMVCTKCKTVLFTNVDKPRTRFFVPLEHRHYCPGCKSTITATGAGFNLKEEVKHTCDACGSDSVFCCATKRDAPATEGMK